MPGTFVIVRDARGSVMHVRRRDDGECVGCIEVGLFEIVKSLVLEGRAALAREEGDGASNRRRSECTPEGRTVML